MKKIACLTLNAKRLTLLAITFLFLVSCFLFLVRNALAGECDVTGDLTAQEAVNVFNKCAIEKNVYDDKIFNLNQIAGTVDSLYTLLLGESQLHPETNAATRGGGALAASGRMVAALYSAEPVSGVNYFASKIQDFNPVQPVYAQEGKGFELLAPVQEIWGAFRNAAYVGFVIVFVIMGFMIMFRAHISPQAVATVQDSIPRVVVALILVTFSYALAGLMLDVMFLAINIVINFLPGIKIAGDNSAQNVFKESIFGVITGSWKDIVSNVGGAINTLIHDTISDSGIPNWVNDLIGFIGGSIAGLVVGIAVLFVMFRIFFMLLMAYVMIIILTIVAPFFFLIQALPGNNGAKEWFKQMAANVAVFATVAIMLIFAALIGGIQHLGGPTESPLKGEITYFPLLTGGMSVTAIGKLIALGFIMMTPSAADMVKKFIGAQGLGGPGGVGAAAGAALGAGAATLGRPLAAPFRPMVEAGRWRMGQAVVGRMLGERPGPTNSTDQPTSQVEPPPSVRGR